MMVFKRPTGALPSARHGRGGAGALPTSILAWLLLALLAEGAAASQAAPAPAPPDPCQMAPNLPYCP